MHCFQLISIGNNYIPSSMHSYDESKTDANLNDLIDSSRQSGPRCRRLHFLCLFSLPARRYASAGNSDRDVSVRPSVCPSVTRRYCVKTKKASVMISSPSGSPISFLVFWRQISSQNSNGFPPSGGLKEGWGGTIQRFSSFKRQYLEGVPRRQPHCRSGLATLPSVGAVP